MRLSNDRMYERMLAGDASCNGCFFTGVLSTGIYCLPSCGARKPRRENVRFFPTCEAARAAGLRPCRKCRPDDYARGADPVLEDIEALVAEIRNDPSAFGDARAIVRRSGFGATRLFELFRIHYHSTPADLLMRARLDRAKRRLADTDEGLLDVAHAAGFGSVSVLHEQFHRANGLTPSAYRALRSADRFVVALPPEYPVGTLRRALGRDPESVCERLTGAGYAAAVRFPAGPAVLRMQISDTHVTVRAPAGSASAAHAIVTGLLGLGQDAAGFARLARKLGFSRLVAGREQLRITGMPSVFDALLWAIIGQQINFRFACRLKRRLFELAGEPAGDGLLAPPTPARVADLSVSDLAPLQFSKRKAEYVIATARLVENGRPDLDSLKTMSATRVERTLLAIRGLGPWSVNYLMMRALGFADCAPLGDTGVTSGLRSLLELERRPDSDAMRKLMAVFSPYRSLATAHLWQLDKPMP